ncbi:uncharacterized protein [Euwallacea similis]|uniref:uncharacterized protein n=1 Tax=Euwallacea similis TaxID=1736056 RepID=UPI00344B3264
MLPNRKRKSSLEREPQNPKIKKLKDAWKTFPEIKGLLNEASLDQTSPEPINEAKIKMNKLLPDDYDFIILTASTKPDDQNQGSDAVFGCIRLPILTKEDAFKWLKKFEKKTFTSYRSQNHWKCNSGTGLTKNKFVCSFRNPNKLSDSCKACLIFTIKDANEVATNPDYYLRDFPSQVIIQFCHNHQIDVELFLRNLRPTKDLSDVFKIYYMYGHSPFSALICHKCDLHSSYGPEFYNVVSSNGICPPYSWCSQEYEQLFNRGFIEPGKVELMERLQEVIKKYNEECGSKCAVLTEDKDLMLCICTPLMKSVFESGFAEDLITVRCFSGPKAASEHQKLILFLCHTPIGSLPFGIVLTRSEETTAACNGIKTLLTLLGMPSYSPKTIIVDENPFVHKTLKEAFSTSEIIFNEFQLLQSIWRVIRLVCENDHEEFQALYNMFLVILSSRSEEDFNRNFDNLQVYADKYPKLSDFVKYFKVKFNNYVLYCRPQVEFNIDVLNYTDSGTIILQDVSVKYCDYFNILQIFDFLTKTYVTHYERKLGNIVDGDLKGFFKTNFYVPLNQISGFSCTKVSDTEFLVALNNTQFYVNAELDTCTCEVGVHGGSCVHQYIVENEVGLLPECYTPLGEDMLAILKSILAYKGSINKTNQVTYVCQEEENANIKIEVDSVIDVNNLGLVDEIFLSSSKINNPFTITKIDEEFVKEQLGDKEIEMEQTDTQAKREEELIRSDEKAGKIAEFLTHLNENSTFSSVAVATETKETVNTIEDFRNQFPDHIEIINEEDTELPEEPYFAEYKVMDKGVLSIVTDNNDYTNPGIPSTSEGLVDSFEDSNLVLISPKDFFDGPEKGEDDATDNSDSKVNILSSVVIKPHKSPNREKIPTKMNLKDLRRKDPKTSSNSNLVARINEVSISRVPTKKVKSINGRSFKSVSPDDKRPQITGFTVLQTLQQKPDLLVVPTSIDELEIVNKHEDLKKEEIMAHLLNVTGEENKDTAETEEIIKFVVEEDPEIAPKTIKKPDKESSLDLSGYVSDTVGDIIEIDSDDLEELASKEYFPLNSRSFKADSKNDITDSGDVFKNQLSTAFGQLTELANKNTFKQSVSKFLNKFKELKSSEKLVSALENFGSELPTQTKTQFVPRKSLGINCDLSDFSDDSSDFEHYSDCRTSCSEYHSELEELDDEDYQEYLRQEAKANESIMRLPSDLPGNVNQPFGIENKPSQSSRNTALTKPQVNVSRVKKVAPIKKRFYSSDDSDSDASKSSGILKSNVLRSVGLTARRVIPNVKQEFPSDVSKNWIRKNNSVNKRRFLQRNSIVQPNYHTFISTETSDSESEARPAKFKLQPRTNSITNNPKKHAQRRKCESGTDSEVYEPTKAAKTITALSSGNMVKHDTRELEHILTGDDAKVPCQPKKNKLETSLLENEELSFLFDDPRFEAIVMDAEEPLNDVSSLSISKPKKNSNGNALRNELREDIDDIATMLVGPKETKQASVKPGKSNLEFIKMKSEKTAHHRNSKGANLKLERMNINRSLFDRRNSESTNSKPEKVKTVGTLLDRSKRTSLKPEKVKIERNFVDDRNSKSTFMAASTLEPRNLGYEDIYKQFLENSHLHKEKKLAVKARTKMNFPEEASSSDSADSEILEKFTFSKKNERRRQKVPDLQLIVLIERNMQVEEKCRAMKRKQAGWKGKRGYKELLENAQRMKFM